MVVRDHVSLSASAGCWESGVPYLVSPGSVNLYMAFSLPVQNFFYKDISAIALGPTSKDAPTPRAPNTVLF